MENEISSSADNLIEYDFVFPVKWFLDMQTFKFHLDFPLVSV